MLSDALPDSFRGRLTLAVSVLVAGILLSVAAILINRLEAYFREQELRTLESRAIVTGQLVGAIASLNVNNDQRYVIVPPNVLDDGVSASLTESKIRSLLSLVSRADTEVVIGGATTTSAGVTIVTPADNGSFRYISTIKPSPNEARDPELTASVTLTARGEPDRDPVGDPGHPLQPVHDADPHARDDHAAPRRSRPSGPSLRRSSSRRSSPAASPGHSGD